MTGWVYSGASVPASRQPQTRPSQGVRCRQKRELGYLPFSSSGGALLFHLLA